MLILSEEHRIGSGGARVCYRHPEDPSKCIKVNKHDSSKQFDEDADYYAILKRRKIRSDSIATYYGKENTNLGMGLVFELMTDFDGSISEDLKAHLQHGGHTEDHIDRIVKALCAFRDSLITNNIIIRDLHLGNLSLRKLQDGELRITMFDGVGNSDYIPLATYNRWWGRKKILRKWGRLEKSLTKLIGNDLKPHHMTSFHEAGN